MTLNLHRTTSELAEKNAALPARYPDCRSGTKERLSVHADRSGARPDRPGIVRKTKPPLRTGVRDESAMAGHSI
jgi:hypothetical protein